MVNEHMPSYHRTMLVCVLLVLMNHTPSLPAVDTSGRVDVSSDGGVPEAMCPASCSCILSGSFRLSVSCTREAMDVGKALSLLFDQTPNISTLIIHGSDITILDPLQLCKLHELETLNLASNSLKNLGDGLLQCLHAFRHLNADHNRLKVITKNTFRGLDTLSDLNLQRNNIEHMSPSAFIAFKVIQTIDLSYNRLKTLDVWPLYLIMYSPTELYINVSSNEISSFANNLNFRYRPQPNVTRFVVDLSNNKISHISDIRIGWGVSTDLAMLLMFVTGDDVFDLRHNPLVCDCVDFNVYKYTKLIYHSDWLTRVTCANTSTIETRPMRIPLEDMVCHVTENCTFGCDCIERPADSTININCNNLQLKELPPAIPTQRVGHYDYDFKYIMRVNNNAIKHISQRSYFHLLDVGDFSHNEISFLNNEILQQFTTMSHIYLNDNKLTMLPQDIISMEFRNLRNLTLHQNPWTCDCKHVWYKSWILNMTTKISSVNAILCGSPPRLHGRSLTTVPDEEFCTDPVMRVITITVSTLGSLVVVMAASLSAAYYMRVRLFAKLKWHPFNKDECETENKEYDVFVSYANEDDDWARNLIRDLEEAGYRTLFHKRDFMGGQPITVNVGWAVDSSKRTLCVLSRHFAASDTCVWEFTTALNIDLLERKHRLITILKEPIPVEEQDPSLKDYLRRFTYIEADSRHFWDNLCYSLSVKKIGPTTTEPNDEEEAMQGPLDHQMPLLNMVAT